jgi:hypothetical protein
MWARVMPWRSASYRIFMTIISKSNKLVTFINIFTVEPANQQQLLDLLARATDAVVRTRRASFPRTYIAASMAPKS